MNIKKGDKVIVTKGKDAGKSGKIVAVYKEKNRVLVEGLNMKMRHTKGKQKGTKGQMVDMSHSINRANVALIDPKTGKATRIGAKEVNGKKIRIAKKSGQEV